MYSYDGIEWIPILNSYTYINQGQAVVWTGINWVVTGFPNIITTYIYYSPDGINWQPSTFNSPIDPNTGYCFGLATDVKTIVNGTLSTTVAVGDFITPGIIYSVDDGVSWNQSTFPASLTSRLNCVAWNGTTWLAGGENAIPDQLYWSDDGVTWNGATQVTNTNIRSIAWNGIVWIAVGNYDYSGSGIQIWYTSVLDGQSGWTQATIVVSLSPPTINLFSVIWNGKRWIAGGHDKPTATSYIFTSGNGTNWFESPPIVPLGPLNPYSNPLNNIVLGLASNSRIGGVIVDSQIALNKTNNVRLTTKLDLYSDDYYNNGYNNMTVSIKSSDLM
jgi:hypothetical protein